MSLDGQAKLSAELQAIAGALSRLLDEKAGEHVLFALHIFGEGGDGRGQYVANAQRPEVRKALRELLDAWDARDGQDDGPYHIIRNNH